MNSKLLLFLCIVVVACATPRKKSGGKKKEETEFDKQNKVMREDLEDILDFLCNGLRKGTLVNHDTYYHGVFDLLFPVCVAVETYMDGQGKDAEEVAEYGKKGNNKGKSKKEQTAEAKRYLHGYCMKFEETKANGFPNDTPEDLMAIFDDTAPICEEVVELSSGSVGGNLIKLCHGLEKKEMKVKNPKYTDLFEKLDPICVELLDNIKKSDLKGAIDNRGWNPEDEEDAAVVSLLHFCWRQVDALNEGLPDDMSAEVLKAFSDTKPICDEAMVISEGGKPKWSFNDFCKGIVSGDIKNTDRKFKAVFKKVKPVCADFLKSLLGPQSAVERVKKGNNGVKNIAVTILMSFCESVLATSKHGVPAAMPKNIVNLVSKMTPICNKATKIANKKKN